MLTAAQAIDRAQQTFPELTDAIALLHLNDEWGEISARYNLRDDEYWIELTEDDGEISLAETVARIQKAYLYTGADVSKPLALFHETELDLYNPSWRVSDSSTPSGYFLGSEVSSNTGVRTMGLYPKPDTSTIAVSSATNADPIVVTTATAHGLSDGDRVRPINVATNTAANVLAYAKVTGYSTTTFAMYEDEDLTDGVAGNGAGTGGHIVAADSPALRIFVHRTSTFVSGDTLPNIGPNADIFVFGICWRYARAIRDNALLAREKALYDDAIAKFEAFRSLQTEGRGVMMLPYHYQPRRVI